MPPQVAYFGGAFAVLALIWLAQGGKGIEPAPEQHDGLGAGKGGGGGGGELVPVGPDAAQAAGATTYTYANGESPSPDMSSPYAGSTDNSDVVTTDGPTSGTVVVETGYGFPSTTFGAGVAGSGIPPLGGGLGIGGVAAPSQAVANAIAAQTFNNPAPSGGQYIPYTGPAPTATPYIPGFASAGGGGRTSRL